MHGLINRSLECFLGETYGCDKWRDIARDAGLGFDSFESMFAYDDALTYAVLDAAARRLSKSKDALLEDLGTYLVSNSKTGAVRRLLRFGGVTFVEFLHSLDDLQERAKLAVPELDIPRISLSGSCETGEFVLRCTGPHPGFGRVMLGLLRAIADDYGALVMLEPLGEGAEYEELSITVVESRFADGRAFSLAAPTEVNS